MQNQWLDDPHRLPESESESEPEPELELELELEPEPELELELELSCLFDRRLPSSRSRSRLSWSRSRLHGQRQMCNRGAVGHE